MTPTATRPPSTRDGSSGPGNPFRIGGPQPGVHVVSGTNETDTETGPPDTVTAPVLGLGARLAAAPTMKAYVPFPRATTIVGVSDERTVPLMVTDQFVPKGNPVSVNVTR